MKYEATAYRWRQKVGAVERVTFEASGRTEAVNHPQVRRLHREHILPGGPKTPAEGCVAIRRIK